MNREWKRTRTFCSLLGWLCLLQLVAGSTEDRGVGGTAAPPDASGKRVALVIGNSAYASAPLRNPVNDAKAMATALKQCGFEVIDKLDCDLRNMKGAVDDFGARIEGVDAALFFYAGHGLQVEGRNYLVPIDAAPSAENEVEFECLDAGRVLAKMENAGARVNIVILDACRNNPLARSWRSATPGLVGMDAPQGSLILFATAPGQVAADGAGDNGVYTSCLLRHLNLPGLTIEQLFKKTASDVQSETNASQLPWMSSSLTGDFYFVPSSATPAVTQTAVSPPPPAAPVMVGHLQVAVNAPAAIVIVDGQTRGDASPEAALNIQDLPVGSVRVSVNAAGYAPQEQLAVIKANEWTQVAFTLERAQTARREEPRQESSGRRRRSKRSGNEEERALAVAAELCLSLEVKDIERAMICVADDFENIEVGDKNGLRYMLQSALDMGYLEDANCTLSQARATKDGGDVTVYPVDLTAAFGAITLELRMQERNGEMRITAFTALGI